LRLSDIEAPEDFGAIGVIARRETRKGLRPGVVSQPEAIRVSLYVVIRVCGDALGGDAWR
jgi:hypothetical protein